MVPAGSGPVGWRKVAAEVALVMACRLLRRRCTVHSLESDQMAAVIDDRDVELSAPWTGRRRRAAGDR